ncbi:MAG: T9SS type A sorting domain-containing protein [Ginsengibacter sp.]
MKPFYLFFIAILGFSSIKSQTVIVSGVCMTGTITLDPVGDVNGKPAYMGTGTVDEIPDVEISVYWLPAPDNLWVLAYSGQPYFQNSCDTTLPWSTGNVDCPWSSVSGQTCTGGTPLALRGAGALVVRLISFTARLDNKKVIVNWKTASEINNKGFDIQRSIDGVNWTNIGFVNGSINSSRETNYQFNDLKPVRGKGFYRLRQVDLDGKYSYSMVASVNFQKSGFYSISNNPGHGIFEVNIEATNEKVEFLLFDAAGRRVWANTAGSGIQTINISNSPAGVYLLRIRKGTDLFTEKLVKF